MDAGSVIRAVRQRQGLTQAGLAKRAGTTQPVVSAYEHGRRDPTVQMLRKLVEAGGERLRIEASQPGPNLPAATDAKAHGQRLLEVLTLVDAIPARPPAAALEAPRLISARPC